MPFSFKIPSPWARRMAVAKATRELEARSDRLLADIGISRRDIAVIANGGYAQPIASASWAFETSERRLVLAAMGRN